MCSAAFSCSLRKCWQSNKKIFLLQRNCLLPVNINNLLRIEKGLLTTHAINICWNEFCSVICSLSLRELVTVPSCRVLQVEFETPWCISSYFREALLTCPKMLQGEFSSSIHFENKWTSVGIGGGFGGVVASIKEERDFFASECLGIMY